MIDLGCLNELCMKALLFQFIFNMLMLLPVHIINMYTLHLGLNHYINPPTTTSVKISQNVDILAKVISSALKSQTLSNLLQVKMS